MSRLHVVAAVIVAEDGQILIARRHDHLHQGGLWEFPGGKLDAGEAPVEALHRELREELSIGVVNCKPLLQVSHNYPDKSVLLDVWLVDKFTGQAVGNEGQPIVWVAPSEIDNYVFPEANQPIIAVIQKKF